jgi:hypothetical protein
MKPFRSLVEVVILLVTLAGMTFVRQDLIPFWIWLLLFGLSNGIFIIYHLVRYHSLLKEDLGPLLASVFFLAWASALPFDPARTGLSLIIAFASLLFAGLLWSAWQAGRP